MGRGRPGKEEEEGSWLEHTSSQPFGALTAQHGLSPEGRQRELGQLAEAARVPGLCFSSPSATPRPREHLLASGHKGLVRQWVGAATCPLPSGAKILGGWHVQSAGTIRS